MCHSLHEGGGGYGVEGCMAWGLWPGRPPPRRWLLRRSVRILLECILVLNFIALSYSLFIVTTRQRRRGKVMFSVASVCYSFCLSRVGSPPCEHYPDLFTSSITIQKTPPSTRPSSSCMFKLHHLDLIIQGPPISPHQPKLLESGSWKVLNEMLSSSVELSR